MNGNEDQRSAPSLASKESSGLGSIHDNFHDLLDEALYESDDFRMYGYKVTRCPSRCRHNWMSCPFVHFGEKARRRDPRLYYYVGILCPDYKDGGMCLRGDSCVFAHGAFEHWLHPDKYRTRMCNARAFCTRRVCFFAHSVQELRQETSYPWY
ncbi:zinc finger CCCH domain-containing protein 54 [Primulina tabacum]|uniref:zinc finger CCCH domain-containing protein 54 n=1 Tax=Primulina tabacum TaxID=48773 RepID=UPI003F592AB4